MTKSLIWLFVVFLCAFNAGFTVVAKTSEWSDSELLEQKMDSQFSQKANSKQFNELTSDKENQIKKILQEQPSFAEFQKQVLKFAAIPSQEEFKKFRKQAKVRNALPNISSGFNLGRDGYFDTANASDYSITRPNEGASTSTSYNYGGTAPNERRLSSEGGNLTYNNNDSNFSNDAFRRNNWAKDLTVDFEINLSKLIYDDEITDILSEQRRFATIRSDYMDRAFDAYHERRKKQISLIINPPLDKTEKIIAELELENLTDRLDSLTGGWFSKALQNYQATLAAF